MIKTKKYNILIVDDIVINRMLLREVIKSISLTIKEAKNGKEAIDIINNHDIDIILMDIEMPVMNGVETTKYIRNEMSSPYNRLPIIGLTAHTMDLFEESDTIGFNDFLTKPYCHDKLLEIINTY